MSDLLKLDFSATEVAKIEANIALIKSVKLRDINSITDAKTAWDESCRICYNRNVNDAYALLCKTYSLELKTCDWSGDIYPTNLMVKIPTGSYVRADRLLIVGYEWEYAENGTIIRANRLYGDKDILGYNTDPLQYLKFRCLPNEKLTYNLSQDASGDDEYSGCAPVFLGIELEVEKNSKSPNKIEHMVVSDLGMDYVILKSDGSLQNGFEIVTAPATLGFHLQAWEKFFENSAKLISSWTSGRCGMHIHISRKAFTPLHLGKLITFLNNNENRDFITTIAGRSSTYSKFNEEKSFHVKSKLISHIAILNTDLRIAVTANNAKLVKELEGKIEAVRTKLKTGKADCTHMLQEIEHGGERHSALNLTKKGTVEMRIFRGNVSKVGMLKNIEFAHAAVEFTREATFKTRPLSATEIEERKLKRKENTDYALHYTFFLDWLQKDTTGNYNNLKLWLQSHKLTDKFTKRKVSSKTPPNKRITEDDVRAVA